MRTVPQLGDPFPYREKITGSPTYMDGSPMRTEDATLCIYLRDSEYIRRMNEFYGVIHSLADLEGFTIISLTRYKPGVVRYAAQRGSRSLYGLANDSVFAACQLPP